MESEPPSTLGNSTKAKGKKSLEFEKFFDEHYVTPKNTEKKYKPVRKSILNVSHEIINNN